jgi:hypothetical protein
VAEGPELLVIPDRIDPRKMMMEGLDDSEGPHYSVTEVAKVFFARSNHWLRDLERKGRLVLDGAPVGQHRTKSGARTYGLVDVEQVAHALAQNGAIDGRQLQGALVIVNIQAQIYGILNN